MPIKKLGEFDELKTANLQNLMHITEAPQELYKVLGLNHIIKKNKNKASADGWMTS